MKENKLCNDQSYSSESINFDDVSINIDSSIFIDSDKQNVEK